jgi:hypothetical protein
MQFPAPQRLGVLAVQQEVLSQVAIDKRVALNVKEVIEHPHAERQTGSESQNERQHRIYFAGIRAPMRGLTE